MQPIETILLEPVGCLAEFPCEPFLEIAARFDTRAPRATNQATRSASWAYWHALNLMEAASKPLDEPMIETFELQAVARAVVYEDVRPALLELQGMGIRLCIASSLGDRAIERFLQDCSLTECFSGVWSRDRAQGIKAAPLRRALDGPRYQPGHAMFLADTAEGLKVAQSVGVNAILMMNDPDESRRLARHNPSGGIVSLQELPDFVRLVRAENSRPPQQSAAPAMRP
jgi:phosphoglycolate phosphatase-like HAD superfamily hydrolase